MFDPKVLAKDQFFEINTLRKHGSFIVNDQEQWKIGNHWLLVVILPQEITFFDSFTKSWKHYEMDNYLHKMKRQVVVNEWYCKGHKAMFVVNFVYCLDIFYVVGGDLLIFWAISMMILVLMRKPGICRCRRFFQTIVEHCKFIYCTVTFILSDHCKYIKTKQ